MQTKDIGLFQALSHKMDWLEHRQTVLAENIANADTPDYRPRDLSPLNFDALLRDTGRRQSSVAAPSVAKTDTSHLSLNSAMSSSSRSKESKMTYEVAPAGNSVVLEEQLIKANEVASDHRLVTNLYQKQVNLLRTALGKN